MQTMKENELMVDDWVESSIEGIGRITEIARDGRIALTYGNNKNAVVGKIEHLQPIPRCAIQSISIREYNVNKKAYYE